MVENGAVRRLGGYREDSVPASLAPWVEAVWTYARPLGAPSLPGRGHRILPHEGVNLLLTWTISVRGRPEAPELLLQGPTRTVRFFRPREGDHLLAVRVRSPWAPALLGVDPTEIADRAVEITEALGRRGEPVRAQLLDGLTAGQPLPALLRVVDEARTAGPDRTGPRLAARGLRLLAVGTRADRAAAALGITPRHFRRVVAETTGVGPKYHQRVSRLNRVMARADADPAPRWSRLALEAGFCDQAHLNREVRSLTGLTPVALHRERRRQVDGELEDHAAGHEADGPPAPHRFP